MARLSARSAREHLMTHCLMDTEGPNQTLQPTASRCAFKVSMTKTVLESG